MITKGRVITNPNSPIFLRYTAVINPRQTAIIDILDNDFNFLAHGWICDDPPDTLLNYSVDWNPLTYEIGINYHILGRYVGVIKKKQFKKIIDTFYKSYGKYGYRIGKKHTIKIPNNNIVLYECLLRCDKLLTLYYSHQMLNSRVNSDLSRLIIRAILRALALDWRWYHRVQSFEYV